MLDEPVRSRAARHAAELALVRVVHHYGRTPEFVLLGGLVPELLCSESPWRHAGTTDVDVQVNLEIASGSANMARLENALRNAEFVPDSDRSWRWVAGEDPRTIVKFELLADLDDQPGGATFNFTGCEHMGAVNLRGTSFAARDVTLRTLYGRIADALRGPGADCGVGWLPPRESRGRPGASEAKRLVRHRFCAPTQRRRRTGTRGAASARSVR